MDNSSKNNAGQIVGFFFALFIGLYLVLYHQQFALGLTPKAVGFLDSVTILGFFPLLVIGIWFVFKKILLTKALGIAMILEALYIIVMVMRENS